MKAAGGNEVKLEATEKRKVIMDKFLLKSWEYILSFFLTAGTFLFGGLDGLMVALLAVIFIDLATGIGVAVAKRQLSSEVGAKGFARKFLMLLVVALGHILDVYVIGGGDNIEVAATLYYILNEGVSIMENCAALGLPVPQKITEVLSQLKKGEGKSIENNNGANNSGSANNI